MSKAKSTEPPTFAETILKAIQDSGLSVYAVAKGSGVSQPILHRFVAGERGLNLDTAGKLCKFLGLMLVSAKPPA